MYRQPVDKCTHVYIVETCLAADLSMFSLRGMLMP